MVYVYYGVGGYKKKGIYGDTLFKKRGYWPQYIDGHKIKDHFTNKAVMVVDVLHSHIENSPIHLFDMKE